MNRRLCGSNLATPRAARELAGGTRGLTDRLFAAALELVERGHVPDALIRAGIRQSCTRRLRAQGPKTESDRHSALDAFVAHMRGSPVAFTPEKPNEQHYELPPEFFTRVLGRRLKYSCCYWPEQVATLDQAEIESLKLTCQRAELADGMDILELGCGWGSLSLWMAEHYPNCRLVAVSNSSLQRGYLEAQAAQREFRNLQVVTADMNNFRIGRQFDRVVSVEMFEHLRNWHELLARIAGWLRDDGKLFLHVFTHRRLAYLYETSGAGNWMGRHFFTGGIMPSEDLLHRFSEHLTITDQWRWDGTHYEKTANAWLANQDARRGELLPLLEEVYGRADANRWFRRWRVFWMACAELWGYREGKEWGVSHYRLKKPRV